MSNNIGKSERASQNRIVKLFQDKLKYQYLGDWQEEVRTQPVEETILKTHLLQKGYSEVLAQKAVDEVVKTAKNLSNGLYDANKEVYRLLRYGVTVREEMGNQKKRFG
jgi:type I restriction enzyme R subunit